jgi:hypothetical protein
MVIDLGTTSHFISEDMIYLPKGSLTKQSTSQNNNVFQTKNRTSLPFIQLSKRAREAHILPHLQQSLLSSHKLSDKGYIKIFHPKVEGVTVHETGTLTITTTNPPVLQGCKEVW